MLIAFVRFARFLLAVLLCALGMLAPAAWAQDAAVGQGVRHSDALPSVQITKLEVLQDVDEKWILADVIAGQAGTFVAQQDMLLSSRQFGSVVWARITLSATPASAQQALAVLTLLELPKNYLDRVRLYALVPAPGAQSPTQWVLQEAGDNLPPDNWSVKGLFPRFTLPSAEQIKASGSAQQVLYLQVVHNAPYAVPINVMSAAQAVQITQRRVLTMGLILGAILMTVVMVGSLAWLYRDAIYVWYCAYAVFAGLACMSHAGFAHQILWPVGGPWPGLAVLVLLMLAVASHLQFSLCAFLHQASNPWLGQAAHTITAGCVINVMAFALFPYQWYFMYAALLVLLVLTVVLLTVLAISAISHRSNLAKAWLVAYVPLVATVVFGLMEGVGLTSGQEAHYQLPIYAAGLEIIILGLALQWFARERHGKLERSKALATVDPLTGFVSAQTFESQLGKDWARSQKLNQPLAVAYVKLQSRATNDQHLQLLMARCVRILRSATSSEDMVARLDGSLLALLIHNTPAGDDLSQKLSRIVALGLMPDASDRKVNVLQFRIAATTRQQFQAPLVELDKELRELLAQPSGWGSKPIRYIDHTQKKRTNPFMVESAVLEEAWAAAFKQEKNGDSSKMDTTQR